VTHVTNKTNERDETAREIDITTTVIMDKCKHLDTLVARLVRENAQLREKNHSLELKLEGERRANHAITEELVTRRAASERAKP
jgi:hypothetical protein